MKLHILLEGQPVRLLSAKPSIEITDLCDDSRRATPGCVFIARDQIGAPSDADFGDQTEQYIIDALQRGAIAVICRKPTADAMMSRFTDIAWATVQESVPLDQALAGALAERFFDAPSTKLTLIGITGTNGKTTTAMLLQHLLTQAGVACGMIGTVVIDDGLERQAASLTTPGAIDFCRYLSRMVANGCKAVVAELSSHGLDQGRTAALNIDVAIFTNLTGDHLDYHGTMDAYADAKAKLFEQLGTSAWAIVNDDDPYCGRMLQNCRARVRRCSVSDAHVPNLQLTTGLDDQALAVQCSAQVLQLAADHSIAQLNGPWGSVRARLGMGGRHNVANALQALAAANTVTAMARYLPGALQSCPAVPGRLEPVEMNPDVQRSTGESGMGHCHNKFDAPTVLVDYAHTHDALKNVLTAMRPVTEGALWVVFGCGGDRDRGKRPKMAAIACQLADRIIITSDNPRTEDPDNIINEVMAGVPDSARSRVVVEPDRRSAIRAAISQAQAIDIVLIAGKGHEDYQILGSEKIHFDDRQEAAEALAERRPFSLAG